MTIQDELIDQIMNLTVTDFVDTVSRHTDVSKPRLKALCEISIKAAKGQPLSPSGHAAVYRLEEAWYQSIADGAPDWDLYNDPDYFADLWNCWRTYSRSYVRMIHSVRAPVSGLTIADEIRSSPDGAILDLGCGMGYTTAILAKLFPTQTVYGTQLRGPQWDMAQEMADLYGFTLIEHPDGVVEDTVSLIFASEYFEHQPAPINHLQDIHDTVSFDRLLCANTFTGDAMGHFHEYTVSDSVIPCTETARLFNNHLKTLGYTKRETSFWNGRPTYWSR